MTAIKADSGKPPLALIPQRPLFEVAKVLGFGAQKYGAHNYRDGFDWSRLTSSSLRHIYQFNEGENVDPETGVSHIAHAICGLLFLLEHQISGLGNDDRYVKKELK